MILIKFSKFTPYFDLFFGKVPPPFLSAPTVIASLATPLTAVQSFLWLSCG
jgi:hypothetical protein